MGRRRSNHICEKCGKRGFKRTNPVAVVHYDHSTSKTRTCYVKKFIRDKHGHDGDPPKKFWGESELYHKLGNMSNHFRRIADNLDKIKMGVYKYKPDAKISTQCVKYLEVFEKGLLSPVEMLLVPYHDQRYRINWTQWFKVQMDSFEHGPRAAGIMNAIKTGQYIFQTGKEPNTVIARPVAKELSSSQVKKNLPQTLKLANELLISHPLEKALHLMSTTPIPYEEVIRDPQDWYNEQMAKK